MKIETFLPCFPGFYGTEFEFNAEDIELEYINEKRAENNLDPIEFKDVKWEYKSYHIEVSKRAVDYIESQLKEIGLECSLVFKELKSPRAYNYATDMIIIEATFDPAQLRKLLLECPLQELLDEFKPRSGFVPFESTLKMSTVNYWMTTGFEDFQSPGWAMQTILSSHENSEFDESEFILQSTHEVEIGVENYSELVPSCGRC